MNNQLYVLPQDCDFISGDPRACAPQLTPKYSNPFRGILLNGPKNVTWPKNEDPEGYLKGPNGETLTGPLRLNVVGLYQLPYNTLDLKGDFSYEILVVAVNKSTSETYSGKMAKGDEFNIRPDLPGDRELDKVRISSSNFYVDLVNDLHIPIAEATYAVYATLGEYKSNVLTITTTVK